MAHPNEQQSFRPPFLNAAQAAQAAQLRLDNADGVRSHVKRAKMASRYVSGLVSSKVY